MLPVLDFFQVGYAPSGILPFTGAFSGICLGANVQAALYREFEHHGVLAVGLDDTHLPADNVLHLVSWFKVRSLHVATSLVWTG